MKPLKFVLLTSLLSTACHADPARLGYYMDATSFSSLKAQSTSLSVVAVDVFTIDKNGIVIGTIPVSVRKLIAANHIAFYPVVANFNVTDFDPAIAKAISRPGSAQDNAIANIIKLASKDVAGINIDIEAVPPTSRAQFTAFITRIATVLHSTGHKLIVSAPAKTTDDPTDSWSGAFDYVALAGLVDTLQIMTYDQHGP